MIHICFLRFFSSITLNLLNIEENRKLYIRSNPFFMKFFKALKLFYIRNLIKNENKIKVLFDHHFFTNQYYLNKSATETHMANILNIKTTFLNEITQKNYNLEFNELCEKYRFAHFWNEFTNPLNAELPINSLINASGFKSEEDFSNLISSHKEESKKIISGQFL